MTLSAAEPVTLLIAVNDGSLTPDLILNPSLTYQFMQAVASNSMYPIQFSSAIDGTHVGEDQYLTSYSYQATAGSNGVATLLYPVRH